MALGIPTIAEMHSETADFANNGIAGNTKLCRNDASRTSSLGQRYEAFCAL